MEGPEQKAPSKLKQVSDDLDTDKESEKSPCAEYLPVPDGRDEPSTSSSGVTGDQTKAVQLSDSGSGEEKVVASDVVMETKDSNGPATGIINLTGSVSGHGNLQNIHSNGPLTIHQTTTVMNNPVLNGHPLATYCTAIQEENKFNVRKLHAELGLRLNDTITKTQLEKLLFFFCNIEVFERRDVEQMRNFMNVWQELEMRGKIRPREYGLLEKAFRSIQHTVCHLDVVQEYMEKIRSEDGVYEGWNMRKYEVIETHEKLEEYIEAYKPLMLQRICFGTVFQNAVFGVVPVEGGEIRLTNGSVRLQVPPKAIDKDVIFSAFCDPPEPQFSLKPGDEPNLVNGDNIVKYSLPVRLGPQNTQFNLPVMLTVTNHSLPNFEKGSKTKPLNVYRKEADTDAWACVGACFFDGDNDLTARISLDHFSSYVLGMPVSTTSLPPLNVHILIEALAPTEDDGNELKVFFMMNDFDYIGGFINQNRLAVDCRTCLYLDPKSDVTVTWTRRRQEEPSSVQFTKEGYLRQELIQNLGVKNTFLSIVQPRDDECACLEKESAANEVYEDVLLLKQNDEIIAELLFNEPQLMPTQQSDQPDSVSPQPQAPTITIDTQIRELPDSVISHLCQSLELAVQMKILKDLGHIPHDMITPVDSLSTNTDVLKHTWHTLDAKIDTLVNVLVNCGCVAAADYLCVEILKVPPVPKLTKEKDFAAIEAVSDIKPDDGTKKKKNLESVTKIGMDLESIKEDFSRLRNRMKKLGSIVRDALDHLDDIAEEYFEGNKSLLLPPEEEEFILSALELRRKPVALFIGQVNSGKSSLINELCQRSHLVPTSEHACTARRVSLDYADDYGSESWQLIDEAGNPQGEPQCLVMPKMKMKKKRGDEKNLSKGRLPADLITLEKPILSEKAEDPKICDVSYINVKAHVHVDILKYGIQLFDTPGFGERRDLDDLIWRLIERNLQPLIIYIIDGRQLLRHVDHQILTEIKGLYPEATIMIVVNKIEPFPQKWMDLDRDSCASSDEEILDTDRLSKYESLVMDKIKAECFLGREESFHTSELFHCISAKQQATARRKRNIDPSDEYVARFQRFEACFLKKMYEQMKHLEGQVMNHVITLMEGFLTMFGKQQPVPICSQKMDEMHADFTLNIDRMKHLRDEAMNLGDQRLKSLEKKVKPVLFLDLCEIYSVQYEIEHSRIELGQEIRRDGRYTIYECPDDDDLVVYVLKKDNCDTVEEWMKGAVEIFNAHDIGRQLGTVNKGEPDPGNVNLINCVGMWMPDRETYHVLFDKTDETVAEYVIREQSSLKQRLKLALKVGQGLALLHRIQYVHLDLRPRNILMRGAQPKIDICRWQSLDDTKIQTDATKDVDIYTFGTLLWTMCEGTFGGSSPTFQHYDQLKQALESGVIPDTPGGRMVGEPKELRVKIYELINHLWTQPELYTMETVNDLLAVLIASPGSMPFDPDQSSISPLGKETIHFHSQSPTEVHVKANPPMPAVDSAESISHQPQKDSSPPDLHLRAGLTRSAMTELQAAKDMDIPDEEDVCRLNLREVRDIMQTMGLSMKGITSLNAARLHLKKEIIRRKPGKKNDQQKAI